MMPQFSSAADAFNKVILNIKSTARRWNCKKLIVKGRVFHNIRRKSPFGGQLTRLLIV